MPASHLSQDKAFVLHHSMLVRMILTITHLQMMSIDLLVLEGVVHVHKVLVVHPKLVAEVGEEYLMVKIALRM